jgi:formamidopyrimidine-DNA glycosylase
MPELPEVETVCRGLEPVMAGAAFQAVEQRRPDLRWPLPPRFTERLTGRRLLALTRRAKFLVGRIEGGETLVMHLGMSGRFTIAMGQNDPDLVGRFVYDTGAADVHDHIVFHMSNGVRIVYNDPRRFGFMDLIADEALDTHKLFADLGVEPLGNALNAGYLAERARGRSSDLKSFLLDQRIIAGLGNIYVSEALFRAGLSPNRRTKSLASKAGAPTERAERLVPVIRDVLNEAIAAGGSTLRDYKHADGALGYFQHAFRVYGREGEPCMTQGCGQPIRRIVQAGRSTFYCSACQR